MLPSLLTIGTHMPKALELKEVQLLLDNEMVGVLMECYLWGP